MPEGCADTVEGLRIDVIDPAGGPKRSIHVGLVLQEDRGSFQIEELAGGEVPSEAAGCEVDVPVRSSFKERISIRGRFPKMWMKNPDPLDWELECTVYPGRPGVDLVVRLD